MDFSKIHILIWIKTRERQSKAGRASATWTGRSHGRGGGKEARGLPWEWSTRQVLIPGEASAGRGGSQSRVCLLVSILPGILPVSTPLNWRFVEGRESWLLSLCQSS